MSGDKCAQNQPEPEEIREQFAAYVVIPSRVFFDKRLRPKAVLFYGLLSSMCNHKGYCWAKNSTLQKYLGAQERAVREWLAELRDAGHIRIEDSEGGRTVRKIYLTDALPGSFDDPTRHKNAGLPGTKMPGTIKMNNININNPPIAPTGGDPDFDRFWAAWPKGHKVAPQRARKALAKALQLTDLETILRAVEEQKGSRQWTEDDGKYIPHPATWLNGGCWASELEPAERIEEGRRYL